jgi:hypothetical protein
MRATRNTFKMSLLLGSRLTKLFRRLYASVTAPSRAQKRRP